MKRLKRVARWVVLGLTGLPWALAADAAPAWQSQTGDLAETDIRFVVPIQDGVMLAASPRHLYRRTVDAPSWKKVLGVRRPDEVVEIAADPGNPKIIWLATRSTVRRSEDSGRSWKTIFHRNSESGFQIRTVMPENANILTIGTTQGLYRLNAPEGSMALVGGSPKNIAVDSLVRNSSGWMVGTSKGIYRTDEHFGNWELLKGDLRRESKAADALGQFSVEEISSTPLFANAIVWQGDGRVLMGRVDGVFERTVETDAEVRRLAETDGFRVRRLASDERFVYLATDRGVYRLEPESKSVENISEGLESPDVSTVAVDPKSGTVWAGTRKGLFKLDATENFSPGITLTLPRASKENDRAFAWLSNEPAIGEIQQAAIHYAEVSPEKIQAWRAAAAKKALLPTVSVDTDFGEDQNVDIDRGGTNDPDKFITGPKESNLDWSVGVSWDLGDLVWNNDQTSIDARSRLMVELRNDILNDVTHLYFERRRAQMELAGLPADVPKLRAEKELKLAELTAQIDGLTGGYLSRRMADKS